MNKQKKPWLAKLLVLVLACSFAFTFALASAPSAHAQANNVVDLGGMNIMGYCRSQGYISVRTVGNTYYSWRCIDRNGNDIAVNMRSVCQWQYHNPNMWDYTSNFYATNVGGCMLANIGGGINARAFCQSEGYADVRLMGNTAYDWRCLARDVWGNPDTPVEFNMDEACEWMYNNSTSLARFADFYTPTSWQCLV